MYDEVGGFGQLLLFCFDYSDNPEAWRHSMELLAEGGDAQGAAPQAEGRQKAGGGVALPDRGPSGSRSRKS